MKKNKVKRLNVQQVEKQVRTSKSEKTSPEHSLNDDARMPAHCKSPYERSSKEARIHLEIEDLKEVVKMLKKQIQIFRTNCFKH